MRFEPRPFGNDVGDIKKVRMAEAARPDRLPVVVHITKPSAISSWPSPSKSNTCMPWHLAVNMESRVVAEPAPALTSFPSIRFQASTYMSVYVPRATRSSALAVELRQADLIAVDPVAALVAPARRVASFDPSARAISLPVMPFSTMRYSGPSITNPFGDNRFLSRGRVGRHIQRDLGFSVAIEVAGTNGVHQTPIFMFQPRSYRPIKRLNRVLHLAPGLWPGLFLLALSTLCGCTTILQLNHRKDVRREIQNYTSTRTHHVHSIPVVIKIYMPMSNASADVGSGGVVSMSGNQRQISSRLAR